MTDTENVFDGFALAIVYLCSPNGISTKLLTLPSHIWS